jgi:glutaredoxin 3
VKEFLSQKGISFTERDVSQDEQALAELEALGVMATPAMLIGDQVVVGFDRAKLEQLLAS